MHSPTMQQEWHRRQHQRSVFALLGLLAVLAHVPAAAALPIPGAPPVETRAVTILETTPAQATTRRRHTQHAGLRYWRELGCVADTRARLSLQVHADSRPVISARDIYLRRFLRPPTA